MNFLQIIRSPGDAIALAKKRGGIGDALGALALAGIIGGAGASIALVQIGPRAGLAELALQFLASGAAAVFLLVLIGGLFVSFILTIILNTLGGRGKLADGLTAVAYSLAAPSIGLLAAALLSFVPLAGAILAFAVLAAALALGAATLYRATTELFGANMITAFVAFSILFGSLLLAVSGSSALLGINVAGSLGLPAMPQI
jgi:hypothetical protein